MGKLILLLGGARSGKSSFAERKAREWGADNVLYVATSEAKDDEMRLRVQKHQAVRPATWTTLEAPRDVARAIQGSNFISGVVLVDCITFLVSNYLMAASEPADDPFGPPSGDPFDETIEAVIRADIHALCEYAHTQDLIMLVVSNEVGMGLVPAYDLGRAYRDLLGRANQDLAGQADEVYLLVAGLPMRIK
ncbi:MAG: bifunctional adenosylcobinamide kinase/adenosylcobinamide-phosphate guanylyltransferase [Chloroflexi bacterium]|nr:bifunctional adenosylcobinamide kinase/adenosylcobinamide-phosphate guanylyltransferase [Chloroflexota bacterium]